MNYFSVSIVSLSMLGFSLSSALADLHCVGQHPVVPETPINLTFFETTPMVTRAYSIEFHDGQVTHSFGGTPTQIEDEPGSILKYYKYKLWDKDGQNAQLEISKTIFIGRGGCGRGSCENSSGAKKVIYAELTYEGIGYGFTCSETKQVTDIK